MAFITFLVSIIILIIASSLARVPEKATILVTRGVIEEDGKMPFYIVWHHPNLKEGDRLIVYLAKPLKMLVNVMIEDRSGRYQLPLNISEPNAALGDFCVMIAPGTSPHYEYPSCRSKVQWMYDRREQFNYFTLVNLVIPGTHQSAAHGDWDHQPLGEQSYISRWILCQTQSIKTQLMDGIRYLDLRPSIRYSDGGKKYILTHNRFALMTVDSAVQQINEFMDKSMDIVIVSFREFYEGFNSFDDHLDFVKYLKNAFSRHVHPYTRWSAKLESFWRINRRLIISYDHVAYITSEFTWPGIPQAWADVNTINELHSYLSFINRESRGILLPWVAMAELTHSFRTIIEDTFVGDRSLRHWAELLGERLPEWFIEQWNSTANIVAVDFYQTTGIVDLAIQLNEGRALGVYSRPMAPGQMASRQLTHSNASDILHE